MSYETAKKILERFDDVKLKNIHAMLFGLGVVNPDYKLAKAFYRFLKEKDYYVKVGLKEVKLRNLTVDEFLKKKQDDTLSELNEQQDLELTEYMAILLKKMFEEFTHSKKFSKRCAPF